MQTKLDKLRCHASQVTHEIYDSTENDEEKIKQLEILLIYVQGCVDNLKKKTTTAAATKRTPMPFDLEKFILDLSWSPEATDHEKTLVAGNLRNLYTTLAKNADLQVVEDLMFAVDRKLSSLMAGNYSFLVDNYRRQIASVFEEKYETLERNKADR